MIALKRIEGIGIGIGLGVMIFMLVLTLTGTEIVPGPRARTVGGPDPFAVQVIDLDPTSLFTNNCAVCHQANGQGLPGQFPPLAGSSWVLQDPETPVRVMLLGIQGEIQVEGSTFNGVMPSQGHLNDEQIAILATYIRSQWGNAAEPVDAALVARVRAELAGRATSWNGGAELQAARQ
jgi:cytochrome c553